MADTPPVRMSYLTSLERKVLFPPLLSSLPFRYYSIVPLLNAHGFLAFFVLFCFVCRHL